MAATSSGDNVIDPHLLVPRNPVLLIGVLMLSGHHTRDFKSRVTWIECIIHLIQNQVLVVLVVAVAGRSTNKD